MSSPPPPDPELERRALEVFEAALELPMTRPRIHRPAELPGHHRRRRDPTFPGALDLVAW
jgi:hypothetical protein